ncbi:MAG: sulfatase-like hydrolase/transferase [Candidatus Lokiarchaeota archaeon]|nr:sulfatase-like hydrolase/transferase [Candidatus Lokiarchaeota archaeon]
MSDRPNILFIMSDDHAFHAISAYTEMNKQRNIINRTPNIDRIGKEGAIFTDCYCTNSICTPSRANILTGKYSHTTGITTLATKMDNRTENFAKIMQKNGYQTAMIGKWHLGFRKRNHPSGFDYWNVLPDQGFYKNPIMIEMGRWLLVRGYTTDLITDYSLNWLENRDKNKPFLLMCHHKAPHRPWVPDDKHENMYENEQIPLPETFYDEYKNRTDAAKHAKMRVSRDFNYGDMKLRKQWNPFSFIKLPEEHQNFPSKNAFTEWKYQHYIKDYLRCIASVDDNVGRLLDYLEQEGILDNTIVIYTSDQGFFLGDHGWYDKRFMYEESLRMPFLIRYPKVIKPNTIIGNIITNIDFAETFLDFAAIRIPENMQGYSFRPILERNVPDDWQDAVYYRYWENGTMHKVYSHYGIRTKKFKLIYYYCDPLGQKGARKDPHEPEWELYDLEKDPYEMYNVYGNAQYAEIVLDLKNKLHKMQYTVGDKPYYLDI